MPADSPLTIRFNALTVETQNAKSWWIDSDYVTSTDGFEFTLYDPDREKLRELDLEMAPVELIVNSASQLIGRIDVTETGNDGSAVLCSGRDYLADLVECNVDPGLRITSGMSLFEALTMAASPVGIDTVVSDGDLALRNIRTGRSVTTRSAPKDFSAFKLDDLKPEAGQGIYDFCNKFVARHHATIQPATDRKTLLVTAPRYDQDPLYRIVHTDDTIASGRNNVLSASARRDFSKFPTYAIFNSRHAKPTSSSKGAVQQFDISEASASFSGELLRILTNTIIPGRRKPGNSASLGLSQLYRLLWHKDDDARNAAQLEGTALRAVSARLKDTLVYTVTLRGHVDPESGAVWSTDTVVQVDDEINNVHEPLWIASRRLEFSPQAGATTRLQCWRLGVYQL